MTEFTLKQQHTDPITFGIVGGLGGRESDYAKDTLGHEDSWRNNATGCQWGRVCSPPELDDPFVNKCCGFYCCHSESGEENDYYDLGGPYRVDYANVDQNSCPALYVNSTLFLSPVVGYENKYWDYIRDNQLDTKQLGQWVAEQGTPKVPGAIPFGCNCAINTERHADEELHCDKMLVTGRWEGPRHIWHMGDDERGPKGIMAIILSLMGPIMFLFVMVPICIMIKQKQEITRYIQTEHFKDWKQRGYISHVNYWAGSKHSQARLMLHFNIQQQPMPMGIGQSSRVSLTCPPGAGPGTLLQVQVNGMLVRLTVPVGVAPGQQFEAMIPACQPTSQQLQPQTQMIIQPGVPTVPSLPVQQQQQQQQQLLMQQTKSASEPPIAQPMIAQPTPQPIVYPITTSTSPAAFTVQGVTVTGNNTGSVQRNQVVPIAQPQFRG